MLMQIFPGQASNVSHLNSHIPLKEVTLSPSLENLNGRIHAPETTKHCNDSPGRCKGQEKSIKRKKNQDEEWLLERTLLHEDILRIIFRFLKSKDLLIVAQYVSFVSELNNFMANTNRKNKCSFEYLKSYNTVDLYLLSNATIGDVSMFFDLDFVTS